MEVFGSSRTGFCGSTSSDVDVVVFVSKQIDDNESFALTEISIDEQKLLFDNIAKCVKYNGY